MQVNELIGVPSTSSTRFDLATGKLNPAGNIVDPSARIARTREAIVGFQHELIQNLAVGVDYIYRKYDRGTTTYTIGYQPGAAGYPMSQLYSGPLFYTDPTTGLVAPYYQFCQGCTRPTGLGSITMTNPEFQVYHGLDFTATKRYSNRWQMQAAVTLQTNPQYFPEGSATFLNPTGREFRDGYSTIAKYNVKLSGSYTLPWDISASANFNSTQGASRTVTINGPGATYGGLLPTGAAASTINQNTLELEARGETRLKPVNLLDLGFQKALKFGTKYQIKLILDAFNVFNVNTVTAFSSGNKSLAGYTQPTTIIAPRVFRIGTRIAF